MLLRYGSFCWLLYLWSSRSAGTWPEWRSFLELKTEQVLQRRTESQGGEKTQGRNDQRG